MQKNDFIIFPREQVKSWDRMPHFCVFEGIPTIESQYTKKNKSVKPIFVGSPVRIKEEGGLLTPAQQEQRLRNGQESVRQIKKKAQGTNQQIEGKRNSIEMYTQINEQGMNRFRNKVGAS